jgi:hypothetical protein
VQRLTTPTRPYRIVDGRLTVSATPSQHSAVEATIAKRRENGWKLFISKVHLYSSQQEIKLDGVEGVHLQHIASDPQSAFAVLNQQQLATLRQRIQGTDQITTIAAPILITMSGDTSCMSTNTQTAFAVDVDDTGEPVGQLIETGVRIDFSQKYVDDKTEFVNLRTTYADIDDIERTTILTKQGKEIAIERPKTSVTFLDLGVLLPTGDAIYSSKPVFVGDNKVPTKYITTIVECRPAQLDKAGIPNANTRFD